MGHFESTLDVEIDRPARKSSRGIMKISCRDYGELKEFREGITPEKNIECTRISFVETPRCRATAPPRHRAVGL